MMKKNDLKKFLLLIFIPILLIFTQCFLEDNIGDDDSTRKGDKTEVCKLQGAECGVVRGPDDNTIKCGSCSKDETCMANRCEKICSMNELDKGKLNDLFAYVPIQFTDTDLSSNKFSVKTTLLPKVDVEAMFSKVSRTDFREKTIDINFGSKTLSLPMTISFKFIPQASNQDSTIMESLSFKIKQTSGGKIEFVSLKDNKSIVGDITSILKTRSCNHYAIVIKKESISIYLNGKQSTVTKNVSFDRISEDLTIGEYKGKVWDLRLFNTDVSGIDIKKVGAPCDDNGGMASPFSASPEYRCGVYVCDWWPEKYPNSEVTLENLEYGAVARDMTWEHNILTAHMYEQGKLCEYLKDKRNGEFRDEDTINQWIKKYTFLKPWGQYAIHEEFHTYHQNLRGAPYWKGSKYFREATASWAPFSVKPGYVEGDSLLGMYTLQPHYALYADQNFPDISGVSTMFSGGHQYGVGIFYAYLTEFVVGPWLIGKINNYPVNNPTEAAYKILKDVGVDMREAFADFAVKITTWDWPIHGPFYAELEKGSYKRMLSKYNKSDMQDEGPVEEVDSKITASYSTNGTGSEWVKVPKRFKVGSWAFNAYEVNVGSKSTYTVQFKPGKSNPSHAEFRVRVVVYNELTGKRDYYKMKDSTGDILSATVDAIAGEKMYLVVASTPSKMFAGGDTYDYEFMIKK